MAQYKVHTTALEDYLRKLIRYAISSHKSEVIGLLQANGVQVTDNVDNKTLYAMVLKAMVSSKSFKHDLTELLFSIAADGHRQNKKYLGVDGQWYNADGDVVTTPQSTVISNDTLNGLITTAIDTFAYKITNGGVGGAKIDENIKSEVNTPAAPPKPNTFKTVVITTMVVGAAGFIIWKLLKKKQ